MPNHQKGKLKNNFSKVMKCCGIIKTPLCKIPMKMNQSNGTNKLMGRTKKFLKIRALPIPLFKVLVFKKIKNNGRKK